MDQELKQINKRVDQLQNLANQLVTIERPLDNDFERRGLWSPERNELEEKIAYVENIKKAAQKGRQIAKSFGFTGENWDPIIAESANTLDHAQELWDHRY